MRHPPYYRNERKLNLPRRNNNGLASREIHTGYWMLYVPCRRRQEDIFCGLIYVGTEEVVSPCSQSLRRESAAAKLKSKHFLSFSIGPLIKHIRFELTERFLIETKRSLTERFSIGKHVL
jgi:hypothetical protein